jgi:hypothetical protein
MLGRAGVDGVSLSTDGRGVSGSYWSSDSEGGVGELFLSEVHVVVDGV